MGVTLSKKKHTEHFVFPYSKKKKKFTNVHVLCSLYQNLKVNKISTKRNTIKLSILQLLYQYKVTIIINPIYNSLKSYGALTVNYEHPAESLFKLFQEQWLLLINSDVTELALCSPQTRFRHCKMM